jgi:hypothetical protein
MARAKQTKPRSSLPTYPRSDLWPPEHIISSLASLGQITLAGEELNDEDRETVERAVRQLDEIALLRSLIEQGLSESVVTRLVEQIGAIAGAAYVIGAHGAMTNTSWVFFERSRAEQMRFRRATSPEEQRLLEVIEAEMKAIGETIPAKRPYKTAERILDPVNKRVAPRTVNVDAIARRIGGRRRKPTPRS